MEKSMQVIEVLNDLVLINNDRISGYQRAIKELKQDDDDLKSLFDEMIVESQQIKSDLVHEIQVLHGNDAPDRQCKCDDDHQESVLQRKIDDPVQHGTCSLFAPGAKRVSACDRLRFATSSNG